MINLPYEIIVESEKETENVAKSFSEKISPGDIILLTGNLGSGKTFFVRSFCSTLGINNVSSPSFAIVNEYEGNEKVYHFDFYRIKNLNELYDIGIDDYTNDVEAIIFIEWADLWREVIPRHYYEVQFNFIDSIKRKITIKKV
ncbi:MAG: tRNA (adenosine(37)-N6)-threonylcarbamoyltransferase complex ATPase subunit type 1 TsaE [Melioribacter sp.]|nr:tRNA (adenosine(37)-N6)-threonylcarbamoyltransferase complex ATPase subunit type 1 TsaE [Melioribacter sp.]